MVVVAAEAFVQPWTTVEAVVDGGQRAATVDEETIEWVVTLASRFMWNATGRRFGVTTSARRPVRTHVTRAQMKAAFGMGVPIGSVPRTDLAHDAGCACELPLLLLPGPITQVDQVMVNGTALAIDGLVAISPDRRGLAKVDGSTWPCSQALDREAGEIVVDPEVDAWSVTYTHGRAIPTDGMAVATLLADHYLGLLPGPCSQAVGLVRLQRKGVTMDYEKDEASSGVELVDEWLKQHTYDRTVRGKAMRRRARLERLTHPSDQLSWRYVDVV